MSSQRISRCNCCVVGCTNNYGKCPKDISFHRFPSEKWFPGRKQKWIVAVNRLGSDGNLWQPTAHSRICSKHFVGGKKSDDSRNPAYIPTIMPKEYKKKDINEKLIQDRFKRLQNRTSNTTTVSPLLIEPCTEEKRVTNASTQTEIELEPENHSVTVLFCNSNGRNVGCQTQVAAETNNASRTVVINKQKVCKSAGCGDENINKTSFSGFESVQTDEQMIGVCGVSKAIFSLLFSFLTRKYGKISNQNRLLIFLMKMKLGMSFISLSVIFGMSRQSMSRIFFSILEEIVLKCGDFVFWPDRETIRASLPSVFSEYPNVRAIIDCTEIQCERPARVEDQIRMFSHYKGYYTLKFLISISPNGFITFVSNGHGGKTTDAFITANCGFLELLDKGDDVMADKGFPQIESHLNERSVALIMPPFATQTQFSEQQCNDTYEIARVRIHVERAIARIKTYKILLKVTNELLPYADSIVRVCAMLVNLQPPLLKSN